MVTIILNFHDTNDDGSRLQRNHSQTVSRRSLAEYKEEIERQGGWFRHLGANDANGLRYFVGGYRSRGQSEFLGVCSA